MMCLCMHNDAHGSTQNVVSHYAGSAWRRRQKTVHGPAFAVRGECLLIQICPKTTFGRLPSHWFKKTQVCYNISLFNVFLASHCQARFQTQLRPHHNFTDMQCFIQLAHEICGEVAAQILHSATAGVWLSVSRNENWRVWATIEENAYAFHAQVWDKILVGRDKLCGEVRTHVNIRKRTG